MAHVLEFAETAIRPIALYDADKNDELTLGSHIVGLENGFSIPHSFMDGIVFFVSGRCEAMLPETIVLRFRIQRRNTFFYNKNNNLLK